jgi:flagellar hook-associated protein 1 FlgK
LRFTSGSVGAAIEILNDDFARFRTELDELAQGIVERVNGLHATGTNAAGVTGVNFFDDFGGLVPVTARSLTLSAAVLADSSAVAAGTPDGSGNYRAGANDVALGLAGLRDLSVGGVLNGTSINEAYRDLAGSVGLSAAAARESEDNHRVLLTAASERRESVSGVATDEELVKIVQIQAAYTAAARVVSVVDEMYQSLLAI